MSTQTIQEQEGNTPASHRLPAEIWAEILRFCHDIDAALCDFHADERTLLRQYTESEQGRKPLRLVCRSWKAYVDGASSSHRLLFMWDFLGYKLPKDVFWSARRITCLIPTPCVCFNRAHCDCRQLQQADKRLDGYSRKKKPPRPRVGPSLIELEQNPPRRRAHVKFMAQTMLTIFSEGPRESTPSRIVVLNCSGGFYYDTAPWIMLPVQIKKSNVALTHLKYLNAGALCSRFDPFDLASAFPHLVGLELVLYISKSLPEARPRKPTVFSGLVPQGSFRPHELNVSFPSLRDLVLTGKWADIVERDTSTWRVPRLENLWLCVAFANVGPSEWSALFGPSWRGVIRLDLGRAVFFDPFPIDSNFWDTFPRLELLSLPQDGTLSLTNGPPNAHPLRSLVFGPIDHSPSEHLWKMRTWLSGCPGVTSIKVRSSLEEVVRRTQREFLKDVLLNGIRFVDEEDVALTKDLLDTLGPNSQ